MITVKEEEKEEGEKELRQDVKVRERMWFLILVNEMERIWDFF